MRTALNLAAVTLLLAPAACIFDITEGTLETGGNGTGANTTDGGGPPQGGSGGDGAGQQNGGGGEGGDGGGIVVPPGCDPGLLGADDAIGPECGIFVDVDSPMTPFDGSQSAPWPTFAEAVEDANDRAGSNPGEPVRVYICGSPNYTGPFHLIGGISLYGGLSCDWKKDATQAPLLSNPSIAIGPTPPTLILESLDPATPDEAVIQDMGIEAATVSAPGDSSIAVWIQSADVTFRRASILAFAGAPGVAAVNDSSTAPVGSNAPQPGACVAAPGPLGGQTSCPNVDGTTTATDGGRGAACTTSQQMGGTGLGDDPGTGGFISATGACTDGEIGGTGDAGGTTAGDTTAGALDADTFLYVPAGPNADGLQGRHGSGGGGGGTRPNGSGGGGGAGGCGGVGGRGGNGGGASFGIAGVDADITLDETTIESDRAGKGGQGGFGARGGRPGSGANAVGTPGCRGVGGGYGGNGGPGGGGPGGPGACVVFVGGAVDVSGDSVCTTNGQAPGGDGAVDPVPPVIGPPGGPGAECTVLELDPGGGISECQE